MKVTEPLSVGAVSFAAACALACVSARGEVHETAEFAAGATRPLSVVILPSEVELTKQRLIRQEAQIEESGVLEVHLTDAVAAEFRSRNYNVELVDAAAIAQDPALQEAARRP